MSDQVVEIRRLLELEYLQVRARIDALENLRFRLKEWAISISGVLIGLGIGSGDRAIVLLCLPIAVLLAAVESDYLVRLQAFTARSDEIETVMESVRRNGYSVDAEAYVFGVRAVSRLGYSPTRLPPIFGQQSRAGFAYVVIIVGAVVTAVTI